VFKRLVETRNSESGSLNSGQTDIKTINKMSCACTFKKLFVNTIEAGLPNLNIGKDHGKKSSFWLR
jgi:hypothetical protein